MDFLATVGGEVSLSAACRAGVEGLPLFGGRVALRGRKDLPHWPARTGQELPAGLYRPVERAARRPPQKKAAPRPYGG
jgi:hypothetical protein